MSWPGRPGTGPERTRRRFLRSLVGAMSDASDSMAVNLVVEYHFWVCEHHESASTDATAQERIADDDNPMSSKGRFK